MNEELQKEVERLKALPQNGYFTLLHHNGPVVEGSSDLMERVNYILNEKPEHERLTRLKNIFYVTPEQNSEYERITQQAWAEYWRITQQARAEYWRITQQAWAEYWRITQQAWAEYERITQQAWAEYERIMQPAQAEYETALCVWLLSWVPFTTWNGKSIF